MKIVDLNTESGLGLGLPLHGFVLKICDEVLVLDSLTKFLVLVTNQQDPCFKF